MYTHTQNTCLEHLQPKSFLCSFSPHSRWILSLKKTRQNIILSETAKQIHEEETRTWGGEKIQSVFSQEAVGHTHGVSTTPALPRLVPGRGLPAHRPEHSLYRAGAARGALSEGGGEGRSHSYSSQACLVRRITFNEFLSCGFRCSSTAEKNLKQR